VRLPFRPAVWGAVVAAASLGACLASAPTGLHRETNGSGGNGGGIQLVDAGPPDPIPDAGDDPHAVIGADPSHGPFSGGQRVLVRGRGFGAKLHVWFGDVEVDPAEVLPVDPSRVQVTAPAAHAGTVDVAVQNGEDASTKRSLAGGYTYDAIYAVPNSGPISGGTLLKIVGDATSFSSATTVAIDTKPCLDVTVQSKTELSCTAPAGTPGSKPVAVTTGDDAIVVLDAFTYQDSDNGYKGGLSGAPLAGHMKVLVYDNYTGVPLPGAYAVLGAPIETAIVAQADMNGVALVNDPSLVQPVTLTVAANCHSPQSFALVPVDTATIYLDPILTPACATSGDPPPVGGKSGSDGLVTGELIWPLDGEFHRTDWQNVPAPKAHERKAAYVLTPAYDPTLPYYPPGDTYVVTEQSPGGRGYGFSFSTYPGTQSFYALAGIENVLTLKFTAYALGVVRGVAVHPEQTTDSVYISMDHTLDQVVTLDVNGPTPGPKGPDRLQVSVAVQLGSDGFLVVPASDQSPLLPFHGSLPFVGLPGLDGSLAGSSYVTSASGVTGPTASAPTSVIAQIVTSSASEHVPVDGFVGVPTITAPATGAGWDGMHLGATFASGGAPVDVTVFDVVVGNALAHWLVAVPGAGTSVLLPDISTLPNVSIPHGPITTTVIGGQVDGFDYASLPYRDIRTYGMKAYALDYFSAHY
jgi:IPT/TIG domain